MACESFDVVLSVDRTLMSNHHGKEFLGFLATGPPVMVPEKVWMAIAAPKVKVDDLGRPLEAPYGLRKIEAALLEAGIKAAVIDPDYLGKHLKNAKVLGIGHHDYFALGPPSSEWWVLTGKEPVNSKYFKRFMEKPEIRSAKKNGLKIIVGGPAAWQWLWMPEYAEKWGVDTIIEGEADKAIVQLVQDALEGKPLPQYVHVGVQDTPMLSEIPTIKNASVNGLVEIMRGCPRGCRFCSVTLRPLRQYPIEMIEKELKVNKACGLDRCLLHAEDILLYGAEGIKPRPEPLIKLHQMARRFFKIVGWSHVSLSAVKYAQENHSLITRLSEIILQDEYDYIGVEVGIETGSPRLAEKTMPAKAAPYPAEYWPSIVKEAFSIMHESRVVPAATIIIGLPQEKPDDLVKTLELIDELKDFRSLIIPMYFVPMGVLKNGEWYRIKPTGIQLEVMKACLKHDLRWIKDLSGWYFNKTNPFVKISLKTVIFLVERVAKWLRLLS
ncbi:MAG: radical SAM protein [Thermoproteota archaeon]